ncbi:hypothetical protein NIES4071_53710 [Calothrix sp. NIES-4071]|nr:hypothetical protein NIES4071_53710 [Calothrix sp. NIES-4071]BAZ59679.1 hypothetical protein NIES4105_53660 [Calothrix sp. NIES-4105]
MRRVCFLDNDIILKLVACNLFSEAVRSLNLVESDLRVLSDAKYVFRNSRRIAKKYPLEIRESAILIVERCQNIQPELSEELRDLQIEGLDPGEMILISATKHEESFYLTTGDKRCITALANSTEPSLVAIKERLAGKLVCLEQLILKIINVEGFDVTLIKVLPVREYDKALKAIFGSGQRCTQDNVLMALEAYINDLRDNAQGLQEYI